MYFWNMPNQKISELSAIETIDNALDVLPIVDTSTNTTKKVTPTQIKAALSLNNVDNTSDLNKPISTATQTALDGKQASLGFTAENAANKSTSVVTDQASNVKYPTVKALYDWVVATFQAALGYTPANRAGDTFTGAISATNLSGTNTGDNAVNSLYSGLAASKQDTLVSGTNIKTIEGQSLLGSGNIDLAKGDVGLGNVDNTSDANKPVSTATQTALDAKQAALISGTNIKTINGTSLLGSGNITISASPSGVAGAIQFSDGSAFASDAANLFWNNTTKRLGIGTNAPSGTAHFKGSGSTSATTSLLVQNSAGTQNMKVTDDGQIIAGNASSGMKYRNGTGLDLGQIGSSGAGGGWVIQMWDNDLTQKFGYFSTIGCYLGSNLTGNINSSAHLQVDSTTKGFLPPRMTTTQKNAIATPAAGLVVYDSTTNKLCCYNGSTWNDLF